MDKRENSQEIHPHALWERLPAGWSDALPPGSPAPSEVLSQLERFVSLVTEYNRVVSLVSAREVSTLWESQIADSLSLVLPLAHTGASQVLDIGSGGGFPAIPLAVTLPNVAFCCLERSERKCGFLLRVVAALGLDSVSVVTGRFPDDVPVHCFDSVTARAVEKPDRVHAALRDWLEPGVSFWCQRSVPAVDFGEAFHVEQWPPLEVAGEAVGRRSNLWRIRRRPETD